MFASLLKKELQTESASKQYFEADDVSFCYAVIRLQQMPFHVQRARLGRQQWRAGMLIWRAR